MEREEWLQLVAWATRHVPDTPGRRFTFAWVEIVTTFLWAVVHNQPVSWACRRDHWPADQRPTRLPSPATLSRRLRRPELRPLLDRLVRHLNRGRRRGLVSVVDGKRLLLSAHSRDAQATFGGRGGRQRGYELHVICGKNHRLEAWAIHPLHVNERPVARRLVAQTRLAGYLLGDAEYDDQQLYELCARRGVQLVAPRQRGPQRGLGHRPQAASRLRGVALLEASRTGFGPRLYKSRRGLERLFGQLVSLPYIQLALPPWVRGLERVRLWVTAKLLLFSFMRRCRKRPE